MADRQLRNLQEIIGYLFTDSSLLAAALTHRSAGKRNNERLEFLGDGILNFVVAEELYRRFDGAAEGELSRLRASLVNKPTLADIAKSFALGDYLQLGPGELKSGGHRRDSILADALEALLGAIYIDSGFDACANVIRGFYAGRWQLLPEGSQLKDPKSRLQEFLQSRKMPLPKYTVIETAGAEHEREFTVQCFVESVNIVTAGRGNSRRLAEQAAAADALAAINETTPSKRTRRTKAVTPTVRSEKKA